MSEIMSVAPAAATGAQRRAECCRGDADLLDPGFVEPDLAVLAAQALEQLLRKGRDCLRRQTLEVVVLEVVELGQDF
jgi:hypothetical protein